MNVFITLNFQIAACFRSQHAEVSICQRVARGAFENYATRLARDKRLPPLSMLLCNPSPPPFMDSHRQRACPRRHYYRRGCGCGSSWATSSFRAATNSFRHRKLGRKQSMTMPPAASHTSPPSTALCAALGPASLCLLHSHISSGRRRRRQLRPSVN